MDERATTMEQRIVCFDKPGVDNMEETLRIAKKRAKELGIKTIVVASTLGNTGARAVEVFKGMKVVVVSHSAGFHGPNTQELTEENRRKIEKGGGIIFTATHLFSGVGAGMRRKFTTYL